MVAAVVAALAAAASGYGYHRDELYFIVAGSHPAFGYPDQPPLVPLVSWAMNRTRSARGSLLLLRTPSALAAAATTVLAGLHRRENSAEPRAPAGHRRRRRDVPHRGSHSRSGIS